MKDKYLIVRKESVFSKIKNWFSGIFVKDKIQEETENIVENTNNITENTNSTFENRNNNIKNADNIQSSREIFEENKARFMELYNNVKNGEVDVNTLDEETAEKICKLLKEEILMQDKIINDKYH